MDMVSMPRRRYEGLFNSNQDEQPFQPETPRYTPVLDDPINPEVDDALKKLKSS